MKKLLLAMLAWIATIGLAFGAVNINTATKEQLEREMTVIQQDFRRAGVDMRLRPSASRPLSNEALGDAYTGRLPRNVHGDVLQTMDSTRSEIGSSPVRSKVIVPCLRWGSSRN